MCIYIYKEKTLPRGACGDSRAFVHWPPPHGSRAASWSIILPAFHPLCYSSPPPALHTVSAKKAPTDTPKKRIIKPPQTRNERLGYKVRQYPGEPAQNWSLHLWLESEERSGGFEVETRPTTQEYSIGGWEGQNSPCALLSMHTPRCRLSSPEAVAGFLVYTKTPCGRARVLVFLHPCCTIGWNLNFNVWKL